MFGVEARGIFSLQRPRTPRWACLGVRRDEIVKTRITCPYGARYSCLLHENVREHQKRAQLGRVFVVHRKGKGVKGSVGGEGNGGGRGQKTRKTGEVPPWGQVSAFFPRLGGTGVGVGFGSRLRTGTE